ncbi:MAG: hypothetical protein U0930_22950, partial [Pirellulales bacterium]
ENQKRTPAETGVLLHSISDDICSKYRETPNWWRDSLLSCSISNRNLAHFEFEETGNGDENKLEHSPYIEINIGDVKKILVPTSEVSLGRNSMQYRSHVQYNLSKGVDQIYICGSESLKRQELWLWAFSPTGRLQWMQSIDFSVSNSIVTELGPKVGNKCRVELIDMRVWDKDAKGVIQSNIAVFAAWENSLLMAIVSSKSGEAEFLFNTIKFWPRRNEDRP